MSDLKDLRDHARTEAGRTIDRRDQARRMSPECSPYLRTHDDPPEHDLCTFERCSCDCHPRHVPTPAERALWTQIADEIDAYLSDDDEGQEALL